MCCADGQWLKDVRKFTAMDRSGRVEIACQFRLPHQDWYSCVLAARAFLSGGIASIGNPQQ
eukprot:15359193-Ditylum_brightwellii.AAC.2